MVFDGHQLLAKSQTEELRLKLKLENLQKGKLCMEEGKFTEARKYFSRSINLNSRILANIYDFLDFLKISVVVAPFEADA